MKMPSFLFRLWTIVEAIEFQTCTFYAQVLFSCILRDKSLKNPSIEIFWKSIESVKELAIKIFSSKISPNYGTRSL